MGRYKLMKDANGIPIHISPPMAPWCPAIYERDDGSIVFVGRQLGASEIDSTDIGVGPEEAAIEIPRENLARLVEAVVCGKVQLD